MKAVVKRAISMKMEGFEVIEKVAESSGNSGRIYVPKKWIGKKVRAVLLE
jgi:putative transposon-encoded protein